MECTGIRALWASVALEPYLLTDELPHESSPGVAAVVMLVCNVGEGDETAA